ncbi:hypothetical protein BCV72DRAFT_186080, partial [Rhizopus microsporus var. microsporus]
VTITSICFAFFGVPVGPLVDGGVLKILGRHKDQYGRQRMFGSISFGVASSLVGFITEWTSDMNAIFYIYALSAICFILVAGNTQFKSERSPRPYYYRTSSSSSKVPTAATSSARPKMTRSDSVKPSHYNEPSNMIELLKRSEVSLFYLTMMLMGASLNMVTSFLFIYLKQELGASSSQIGLTGLIGSSTELIFFFYSR